MKLLFENWRKYVNEQIYLIQNAVDHESNFYESMEEDEELTEEEECPGPGLPIEKGAASQYIDTLEEQ